MQKNNMYETIIKLIQRSIRNILREGIISIFKTNKTDIHERKEQFEFDTSKQETFNTNVKPLVKSRFSVLTLDAKLKSLCEHFEKRLTKSGILVVSVKPITNGVQAKLKLPSKEIEIIRIYNTRNRGLFFDLSIIKNEANYEGLKDATDLSLNDYFRAIKRAKAAKRKAELKEAIEFSKAQRPYLESIADDIIKHAKDNNISVMRYDSKSSESIYLKFDYGMAGNLRISAHKSNKRTMAYTFNIIKGLDKPYSTSTTSSSGKILDMHFYPSEYGRKVALDIVRYKKSRVRKFSEPRYNYYMSRGKSWVGVRAGFWTNAVEV